MEHKYSAPWSMWVTKDERFFAHGHTRFELFFAVICHTLLLFWNTISP